MSVALRSVSEVCSSCTPLARLSTRFGVIELIGWNGYRQYVYEQAFSPCAVKPEQFFVL
jgi:hypothetical protein